MLYVSGYAEATIVQHGVPDLGTIFLQKPFTLKALASKITMPSVACSTLARPRPKEPGC